MKLYFVTGNKSKFDEGKKTLEKMGIELEWINEPKPESPDQWDIKQVAIDSSKELVKKYKKRIVVEDTGLFIDAYNHFPGPHSKFVYHAIGLKGILKLLEGKERGAVFRVVVALCEPGKEPITFEGTQRGTIAEEIHGKVHKIMPYRNIFIPEGQTKPLIEMSDTIAHREQAFEKLGKYLKNE